MVQSELGNVVVDPAIGGWKAAAPLPNPDPCGTGQELTSLNSPGATRDRRWV